VQPALLSGGAYTASTKAAASPPRPVGPSPLYGLLVPGRASVPGAGRADPCADSPIGHIDHSRRVSSASWKTIMIRTHSNRKL
jgi:hypothetical protein